MKISICSLISKIEVKLQKIYIDKGITNSDI